MAKCGYSAATTAPVALTAAAVKSVIGVKSAADFGVDLIKFRVSFNGVSATAVPALITLEACTFATNSPGTASTSVTPIQAYGRVIAHGVTAAVNWTTEPTALSVVDRWLLTPNGGTALYDFPLGTTPDSAVSTGFVIRINAPAAVSAEATIWWERC